MQPECSGEPSLVTCSAPGAHPPLSGCGHAVLAVGVGSPRFVATAGETQPRPERSREPPVWLELRPEAPGSRAPRPRAPRSTPLGQGPAAPAPANITGCRPRRSPSPAFLATPLAISTKL